MTIGQYPFNVYIDRMIRTDKRNWVAKCIDNPHRRLNVHMISKPHSFNNGLRDNTNKQTRKSTWRVIKQKSLLFSAKSCDFMCATDWCIHIHYAIENQYEIPDQLKLMYSLLNTEEARKKKSKRKFLPNETTQIIKSTLILFLCR